MAKGSWLSRFACWLGAHDWSDGPGFPCVECNRPDEMWAADDLLRFYEDKR
jgi:hypothetical protein